ncbi:hypothetical protein [Arthrobacter sp. N1]|uniref:hypothetical protein n=1 Tax=Arthrobacter sp. N1 TaxID=619291 RepID=UPI003BB03A8C
MAVIPPSFINTVAYSGETLRRDLSGLAAGGASAGVPRTGLLDVRGMGVSLSGTTVRVDAGPCIIGSAKGGYLTGTDALTTIRALTASDATNPRLDRVVLEVLDPDNGIAGGNRTGQLRVIDGVAAAIPGLPVQPALSIHLGQILVPANGGAPAVTVNPPLTAAEGAPIPVRSKSERDALPKWGGLMVQRIDLGWAIELWDGAKWTLPSATPHLSLRVSQSTFSTPNVPWGMGTIAQLTNGVQPATRQADQFTFPFNDRVAVAQAGVYTAHYVVDFFGSDGVTPKASTGWIQISENNTAGQLLGAASFSAVGSISATAAGFYLPAGGIVAVNYQTASGVTANGRFTLTRIA